MSCHWIAPKSGRACESFSLENNNKANNDQGEAEEKKNMLSIKENMQQNLSAARHSFLDTNGS